MKMKSRTVTSACCSAAVLLGACGYAAFRELSSPFPPKVAQNKKLIACIGDSITFGAGVIPKHRSLSYPALLQELAGDKYQVLNYGLSGRTLLDEGDSPYRKENFYQISRNVPAETFIIMLGTNDSKPYNWNGRAERYRAELTAFVREYQGRPSRPSVVVMQPPKAFPVGKDNVVKFDIRNEVIENEIHPIVAEVCVKTGATCIDLYSYTADHPEWFSDGVHPNEAGNRAIAKYLYEQLNLR